MNRKAQAQIHSVPPPEKKEGLAALERFDIHVTGVRVQVEIDLLNKETGKLESRVLTEPQAIFEHAFFPGLEAYLRAHGLGRGLPPEEATNDAT